MASCFDGRVGAAERECGKGALVSDKKYYNSVPTEYPAIEPCKGFVLSDRSVRILREIRKGKKGSLLSPVDTVASIQIDKLAIEYSFVAFSQIRCCC